ncbi:fasciclin domain-containing protein [Scytonema hofmannii FACHB-248]|uniref:Fasciclin domain-containing protein n=1 Tax=Scytonema hofmannii FACHB-248 TaxID=1842502 RepID=A0ABR8GVU4_9CYAN|nr:MULTISPECIES: fasciclin domain-containing protein [Nostocales]MBD2607503.1 fasciclin domain-containing protein [Scytonema hofmannii FACHB-248]
MKKSNSILAKVFFSAISVASVVALSACNSQPVAENPTVPPATETQTTVPPTTETPATTVPSVSPTPTGTTANQNLGELAQTAASQGSFITLTKAVEAAGLTEQLAGKGPYTVFAPTDAAFAALPKGTVDKLLKPENKSKLVKLLAYHVVPGQVTSSQLASGKVKTVEGTPVTIKVDSASNTVTVNGAKVLQADIPASNGIVHVVDKVIVPPNFK